MPLPLLNQLSPVSRGTIFSAILIGGALGLPVVPDVMFLLALPVMLAVVSALLSVVLAAGFSKVRLSAADRVLDSLFPGVRNRSERNGVR